MTATFKLTAIVSGGQVGADRGALDAAIALDLGYGGWAPAGLRAEDGVIPEIYAKRMRCSSSADYGMRTRLNVQDSDGTLLVSFDEKLSGGSAFTEKVVERARKPYLHLVLPDRGKARLPDEVRAGVREWVSDCRISVLNVAGPRESKCPGIQEAVRDLLVWIFEPDAPDDAPPATEEEQATHAEMRAEIAEMFGTTTDPQAFGHTCTSAYSCANCDRSFCWDCEFPVGDEVEIKTIGSRYCAGCIEADAAAQGLTVDAIREQRLRAGRPTPTPKGDPT
ncbi:MAG TPA: putative molybdenum carrier protein [Microbacterium sp.]|nr:putative molybdenum carrier protein [Microbacterium sp.]